RFGHSRDGRHDKMQIVFVLLCSAEGCRIAIEVFEGNTGDPATLGNQITKLKERFGLNRVVVVGDRGMITQARIEQDLKPAGLDWITALRAPAIQKLATEGGPLQLSLFDDRDLAEIESPDFPGERLIVCRNPALAEERRRKRDESLDATEHDLKAIQARILRQRRPLRGPDKIGRAVGASLGLCMVAYYLEWHMRRLLAPILFDDHDRAGGEVLRSSPVAKAQPSPAAKRKAKTKRADDGLPVHSFHTLLADLATLTRNTVRFASAHTMTLLATPTQIQQRTFDLLDLKPQL